MKAKLVLIALLGSAAVLVSFGAGGPDIHSPAHVVSTPPPPGADLVVCEEGMEECPIQISLADKVTGPTTMWIGTHDGEARAGTDYHPLDEVPVQVPAGATAVEVSVRLIADTACETPEHFSVVLTGREFVAEVTVKIIDDC